jgi:hypothetical protein
VADSGFHPEPQAIGPSEPAPYWRGHREDVARNRLPLEEFCPARNFPRVEEVFHAGRRDASIGKGIPEVLLGIEMVITLGDMLLISIRYSLVGINRIQEITQGVGGKNATQEEVSLGSSEVFQRMWALILV